jgi:hypothetical protein
VVVWGWRVTAVGAYNSSCLVDWDKMEGFKIDGDSDNALGMRLGSRANCSHVALLLSQADDRLCPRVARCRGSERRSSPLSWALGFGLWAPQRQLRPSVSAFCPAQPTHFALTTDCTPRHNTTLLLNNLPHHTQISRSPTLTSQPPTCRVSQILMRRSKRSMPTMRNKR